LDAVRGVVMIIMALDHVRDFFHFGAMSFQPDDLTRTTTVLFVTRWVTHFCAPVFFFAAGAGAFLWMSSPGRTPAALSRFLWTRGLWLMVLELTVVRFSFFFSLTSGPVLLTVLWTLGVCMIILAVLCRVPVRLLAAVSLAAILLHNLVDPIRAADLGSLAFLWRILHEVGVSIISGTPVVFTYPLIPWFAVMSAGYCFGRVLLLEPQKRQHVLLWLGLAATVAFVALRTLNVYGDPVPWTSTLPGPTLLSFLRVTKYPPSLLFLLMTLGPALALWSWLDRIDFRPANPLLVIGRVPLFFFLTHFLLAHVLAIPFAFIRYGEAGFLANPMPSLGGARELYPPDFGYGLGTVYLVWVLVVALEYPLCVWFDRIKQRKSAWWLSYF
jgi:uncharacterized membrane protein